MDHTQRDKWLGSAENFNALTAAGALRPQQEPAFVTCGQLRQYGIRALESDRGWYVCFRNRSYDRVRGSYGRNCSSPHMDANEGKPTDGHRCLTPWTQDSLAIMPFAEGSDHTRMPHFMLPPSHGPAVLTESPCRFHPQSGLEHKHLLRIVRKRKTAVQKHLLQCHMGLEFH